MMKRFLLLVFLAFLSSTLLAQEICDNGIDDDGDSLIDRNDTADCQCAGIPGGVTSLIPNPSFEESLCCPTGYSQMQCVASWIQASDATTDYYNCGYTPPTLPAILHPPAATVPLPNQGTGYIGCISEEYRTQHPISKPQVCTQYRRHLPYFNLKLEISGTTSNKHLLR